MTRSGLNFIGGMLLLMVLAYGLLPSVVGSSKLKDFCTTIQAGESTEKLIKRSDIAGYTNNVINVAGTSYILVTNKKEVSRFVCEVTVRDESVASARYLLNKPENK